jgi:hypothetical protein
VVGGDEGEILGCLSDERRRSCWCRYPGAAARIGLVTGSVYLCYTLLIDLLPGWHVGGGDMAMPRVALLGDLLSGSIGGSFAFRLFQRS